MRPMAKKGLKGQITQLRRWLTLSGMRGILALGRLVGPNGAAFTGSLVGSLAGSLPFMRNRLATNLRAAGFQPTRAQIDRYFRHLASWAGWSASVYVRGFVESGVAARITLDSSFKYIDEAMARGRGIVLSSPHMFCHELGAAAINRRHPVVALVRESKNANRETMKARWYEATGLGVVKRPRKSSVMADTIAAIRTLQGGAILGITPDIIMPPDKGIPVQIFGRTVHMSPGLIVLASRVGAPIVSCRCEWFEGRTPREDRMVLKFDPPIEFTNRKLGEAQTRQGLQDWCRWHEASLAENPEAWMLWLDKHWTKALRSQAA